MATPDLAGFANAQERHRQRFGEDVIFLQPASVTFPPGTPLDPETGESYDPTIKPTASAQASAAVKCNVAYNALRGNPAEATALGLLDVEHVMLIAGSAARADIEGATEFVCRDQRFKVVGVRPDGIGGVQRTLAFGRLR